MHIPRHLTKLAKCQVIDWIWLESIATAGLSVFSFLMLHNFLILHTLLINFNQRQLQLIQNTAARIVTHERKFCNITPILKDLHWLPVAAPIDFKVILQVYKCLHGTAPVYLSSKHQMYACPKLNMTMISAMDTLKLYQPSYNRNEFSYRAFSVAGPRIWNPTQF